MAGMAGSRDPQIPSGYWGARRSTDERSGRTDAPHGIGIGAGGLPSAGVMATTGADSLHATPDLALDCREDVQGKPAAGSMAKQNGADTRPTIERSPPHVPPGRSRSVALRRAGRPVWTDGETLAAFGPTDLATRPMDPRRASPKAFQDRGNVGGRSCGVPTSGRVRREADGIGLDTVRCLFRRAATRDSVARMREGGSMFPRR